MPYLFDTNAISELFKRRPNEDYLEWIRSTSPEEHFTSIIAVGELYVAAYRSKGSEKWFQRIREHVLSRMTVLPFDLHCAEEYGRIRAHLADTGKPIGDIDAQLAATARLFDLVLVTANVRHFDRVPDLPLKEFKPGQRA